VQNDETNDWQSFEGNEQREQRPAKVSPAIERSWNGLPMGLGPFYSDARI